MSYHRSLLPLLFGMLCLSPASLLAAQNLPSRVISAPSGVSFTGEERISKPAVFEVDTTLPANASPSSMVGQPLTVQLVPGREVIGIIESIEQTGGGRERVNYHVRLVSPLSRLNYRITSRSFHNMNVADIVKKVLGDAGIPVQVNLVGGHRIYELTTQYQESDLAFISRLLEKEGMHFHFRQGDTVVISDSNAFPSLSPGRLVVSTDTTPAVFSFQRGLAMHSGQVQIGDYAWTRPNSSLTGSAQSTSFTTLSEQIFPAAVEKNDEATALAKVRLEAQVATGQRCRGESTYPQVRAGYRFTLAGHSQQSFNQEYIITSVRHRNDSTGYRNSFTCLPIEIPYRDKLETPRPSIAGVVPGIVVGPSGETKHVNQFGQVRIRFPWRYQGGGSPDSGDAGWVRVMQQKAGAKSTSMWLPEVGEEVAVAFENGNPDRPVVLGSFYNGANPPPAQLPANRERSLFRVQSSTGNITEILFDNTAGREGLTLRSGNQAVTVSPRGISSTTPIAAPR